MFPVSDPQIKLTHCLLAGLCMKVTVGFLLLTFHKEFHSNRGFPRKQNRVFNLFALTPLSLCVSVSLTQLLCSLERTIRASRCSSSSSITATCIRPACHLSDLSPLLHTQAPWYTLLQQSFFFGINLKFFFPENKFPETLKSVSRPFCSVFTVRCMTTRLKITMRSHSGTATSSSTLSPSTRAGCTAPCREPASPACCRQTTWSVATKAERKTSLWERAEKMKWDGPEIHSYIHLQRYKSSWWCSLHFRAHLHFQCYGKRERQVIDC